MSFPMLFVQHKQQSILFVFAANISCVHHSRQIMNENGINSYRRGVYQSVQPRYESLYGRKTDNVLITRR